MGFFSNLPIMLWTVRSSSDCMDIFGIAMSPCFVRMFVCQTGLRVGIVILHLLGRGHVGADDGVLASTGIAGSGRGLSRISCLEESIER